MEASQRVLLAYEESIWMFGHVSKKDSKNCETTTTKQQQQHTHIEVFNSYKRILKQQHTQRGIQFI